MTYRRAPTTEMERPLTEIGPVLTWDASDKGNGAAIFLCPCGAREVYVTSPPHKIIFAEDGTLDSLGGSCGYKAKGQRPQNWCHFTIKNGEVETMHDDSKCPGGDGSIP